MAAPVITSPLTLDLLFGMPADYRITATNNPTSFDAPLLPVSLRVNTATGRIGGVAHLEGTFNITISATNSDGTGTATLVITILPNSGGGGTGTVVTVYQSKVWADGSERFDYADADSAGHLLAEIVTDSIGSTQLATDALANKIALIGGPGRIGQYVFANAFTFGSTARFAQKLAVVTVAGTAPGDLVVVDELLLVDGTAPAVNNTVFYGVALAQGVSLYAFNGTGTTIPVGARLNFRVFNWPNGQLM